MGRGKRRNGPGLNAAPVGAMGASLKTFRAKNIALDELLAGRGSGEIITLAGGDLVTDDETSPLIARGLMSVLSVQRRPDGLFYIRFQDGEKALIDLEGLRIAVSDGTSAYDPRLFGAFCRAYISSCDETDPIVGQLGHYLNEPGNPELLATLTKTLGERLGEMDGDMRLNNRDLQALIPLRRPAILDDEEVTSVSSLGFERGPDSRLSTLARDVQEVVDGPKEPHVMGPNERQLKGIVFGWKDQPAGIPADLTDKLAVLGPEAAAVVGEEIVDPAFIENLYLNDTLKQAVGAMIRRYELGQRTFGALGHQGTGKDTLFKVTAALLRRPIVTLNGGRNIMLQEWIGGEALIPHKVYDSCGECVHCKADEPGKCKKRKLIAAFPISAVQYGKLTQALQTPSVIHISEIRGMEDQLLAAHDWMGSGIGADASDRFLTINSPQGTETIKVHEHCLICFSWNPDTDDWRPHPATMRRMGLFCFSPLSKEEEAERLAAMCNTMFKQQALFPELHSSGCDCETCTYSRTETKKAGRKVKMPKAGDQGKPFFDGNDLLPVAEFFQRFQNAVHGEADIISTSPSPQLFSYFFFDVVMSAALQAASSDDAVAGDHAVQWSMTMLEGYLNQTKTRAQQKKELMKLLDTARVPLDAIVQRVRDKVLKDPMYLPPKAS